MTRLCLLCIPPRHPPIRIAERRPQPVHPRTHPELDDNEVFFCAAKDMNTLTDDISIVTMPLSAFGPFQLLGNESAGCVVAG